MARTPQKVPTVRSLAREISALTKRLAALERVHAEQTANREQQRTRDEVFWDEWDRLCEQHHAATEARHSRWLAISEFDRQYFGERIRAIHPEIDEVHRERRRQLNEFLAARGMEPEPVR
jgi:hypothetical protein